MARTAVEQRAHNTQKMREYREKKKQQKAATTPQPQQAPGVVVPVNEDTVATPGGVDDTLTVDVKVDAAEAPQLSFVERTKQKLGIGQTSAPAAPAKRIVSRAKKKENLLTSTLPTVMCAFIATYSRELIADPYKPCAPSQEEVTGIIGPLMDILARQVEITGKMSQTTIDLTNSLLCAFLFGIRSYMTYTQIKNPTLEKDRHDAYREKLAREAAEYDAVVNEQPLAGGMRSHQAAPAGLGRDNRSQYAAAETAIAAETYDASSNANSTNGHTEGRDHEADIVSSMFKRDIAGRERLGLLPSRVRD